MAKKTYRCPVIGTGSSGDEFRPSLSKYPCSSWVVPSNFNPGTAKVVVEVEATALQHTVIALDTLIEVLL
ncbi:hypothetical protein QPK31_23290 [Massilia sp. YIM B02769]|uniref:hypothetical protein n=1 Tax=Massilia sp. YIM B02769 TaxID=3050129 RepID=UPI0025B6891D|nr:hypothetical protein [Massilia sp. YIM B02769]MDN4061148.1 hypothetical protein [Massilia sp. YIM B02769]